jgi:DNA-binding PucR family transcriptional regulator
MVGSGVNSSHMEAYAMILNDQLFDNSDNVVVHVGISYTVIGYNELQSCYRQAVTASNTAKIQEKQILKYHDTGIYKLIYAVDDASVLKRYVLDTINKISEYDSMHNTDYIQTLKHYLESDGSIQKVSTQMNVHRNTINYKMKSIRDNFGLKLDYSDIARLWLAFNIKEIKDK